MQRVLHVIAGVVGIGVLAAMAHTNIIASGGYEATGAPLLVALAAGLAIGAISIGLAFDHGRKVIGSLLIAALVAGELFMLQQTAERTLVHRDQQAAPIRAASDARVKAQARLERTEKTVQGAGESERLKQAIAAKTAANQAVTDSAAKRGCASNCRKLLQAKVADAAREVELARAEVSIKQREARAELDAARAALAALPAVRSVSPLADRLGVAGWTVDLTSAALASLAINGLAAFLIAFGAPALTGSSSRPTWAKTKAPRDATAEAEQFASLHLRWDENGRVRLEDLRTAYHAWCADKQHNPLPDQEIGRALSALFFQRNLTQEHHDDGSFVVGVSMAQPFRAALRENRPALQVISKTRPQPQRRLGHMTTVGTA